MARSRVRTAISRRVWRTRCSCVAAVTLMIRTATAASSMKSLAATMLTIASDRIGAADVAPSPQTTYRQINSQFGGCGMTRSNSVDAARVELLLSELRLPSIKLRWAKLAEQSDKEGWPAARFLAAFAEHEVADRSGRRMERHLIEARGGRCLVGERRQHSALRPAGR